MKQKIFGIGLARTGTTSLSKALEMLGYKTLHAECDILYVDDAALKVKLRTLIEYDAIVGTPIALHYKMLEKYYPNAKFILTIRDIEDWLRSCSVKFDNLILDREHKILHSILYGTMEYHEGKFMEGCERHMGHVIGHFGNENLLLLDICKGEGWEKLCKFLSEPVPDCNFPHLASTS